MAGGKIMSKEDFFKNQTIEKTNIQSAIVSEVKPNETRIERTENNHPIVFEVSIGVFLLSGIICFLMLSKTWIVMQEEMEDPLELPSKFSQSPCTKCRFFSSNPFLKCAVNPTLVLTKEAVNCSDYRPRNKKSPH
jgi:hypothetical protein